MDGAHRLRRALREAGRRRLRARAVALAASALAGSVLWALAASAAPASGDSLLVYALRDGRFEAPPGAPVEPVPIGSLAKPFVARAWARAHPGATPPVVRCDGARCWRPSGHGALGLPGATAVSCNAYFRALAADTPADELARALRAVDFDVPVPLTADGAIGLPTPAGILSATPRRLLAAYVALLREPWGEDESVRRLLLAGMRDGAHAGTAAGLDALGFLAKTGTVPALDGRALATSGWVVAADPSGRAYLGLLPDGTGRQAAQALAARLGSSENGPRASRPASPRPRRDDGRVRVLLLGALSPRRVVARNVSVAPLASARGYVGAGGRVDLRPGDRLSEGDWELSLPGVGLRRVLRGALAVLEGPRGTLRLRAEVTTADYVAGVVAAELPGDGKELRVSLAAAVLRFLALGPRHGDADVCDLTHCAWFIGRGPRAAWPTPARPVLLEDPRAAASVPALDAETWSQVVRAAREPGPDRWTGHCGGAPLPAARVWGGSDRRVFPCPRHGEADRAAWARTWPRDAVERAFGRGALDLRVESDADGRWRLAVGGGTGRRALSWDEAHARLAAVLGWDALPSPADRVERAAGGTFRASGRGRGHRVGLCLAAAGAGPLLD